MPDHIRKQIKNAVKANLTGLGITGANVFLNRVNAIPSTSLPALGIYSGEEDREPGTTGSPAIIKAVMEIIVAVGVSDSNYDQITDEIIAQVEVQFFADKNLGRLISGYTLDKIERPVLTQGENEIAITEMIFSLDYTFRENDPYNVI